MRATPFLCAAALLAAQSALAQSYPNRPVRFVIGAVPGGGTDLVARLLAPRLAERLGQPFVPDNRGGSGGAVAVDIVVKAQPDGYTLLVTSDALTAQASLAVSAGNATFDVLKDLAPVGVAGRTGIVLGVHPGIPAKSVGELVEHVRANPGKLAYSSCGAGTPLHLAGEMLKLSAKIDLVHIAYRGCAPAMVDAVSGQVPIFFNMIGNALAHDRSGKVRLLAVATTERLPGTPSLPTISESGFPAFEAFPWYGVLAPGGTPKEIVARLNTEITAIVKSPEVQERMRGVYFEPVTASAEGFAEIIRSDYTRWTRVIRDAKIKAD